ncbi:unnamed protein product, partial [Prorocentrum cordatum]
DGNGKGKAEPLPTVEQTMALLRQRRSVFPKTTTPGAAHAGSRRRGGGQREGARRHRRRGQDAARGRELGAHAQAQRAVALRGLPGPGRHPAGAGRHRGGQPCRHGGGARRGDVRGVARGFPGQRDQEEVEQVRRAHLSQHAEGGCPEQAPAGVGGGSRDGVRGAEYAPHGDVDGAGRLLEQLEHRRPRLRRDGRVPRHLQGSWGPLSRLFLHWLQRCPRAVWTWGCGRENKMGDISLDVRGCMNLKGDVSQLALSHARTSDFRIPFSHASSGRQVSLSIPHVQYRSASTVFSRVGVSVMRGLSSIGALPAHVSVMLTG